jgi:ferredoxin-type protein NapG
MAIGMGDRDRVNSLLPRRAFIEWVGKGAVVVALGGLMRSHDRKREFLRPPGALPEEEFLSLCTRCGTCREACPYGFISTVPLTESVIAAGTPIIRHCIHCLICTWACPTGALGGRLMQD